ncbi:MAG: DUF3604 domain-containing protein [Myxococcota bacterium]
MHRPPPRPPLAFFPFARLGPLFLICVVGLAMACSSGDESGTDYSSALPDGRRAQIFETEFETISKRPAPEPDRAAFFGDLHVHTTYSFDAFAFGTMARPSDAYRYARGEAIPHPAGFQMQLREPLDFYAVTDHGFFMGVVREAAEIGTPLSEKPFAEVVHELNAPENMTQTSIVRRIKTFGSFAGSIVEAVESGEVSTKELLSVTRTAWADTIDAADRWNDPGRFTTFVAYEYTTSSDDRGNLHRNVIFRDSAKLPAVPFSRMHSRNPEDLWDWMDALRADGVESLAIPHNSNGSNGQMFKLVDWAGDPLDDEYGIRRMRNEPIVEITQIKGTSETHPSLSNTDEWAGFEITPYRVATMLFSEPKGSYARDALREGLALEAQGVTNAFDFGFVGASDTHTGATSDDESNYFSKLGLLDGSASRRASVPLSFLESTALSFAAPDLLTEVDGQSYLNVATPTYGASGLTGVWAEENTRASIYEAFRRKETFATSGPRIRIRFFASQAFGAGDGSDASGAREAGLTIAEAYAKGVPMGGKLELEAGAPPPRFKIQAIRDPRSAALARLQVIKGWVEGEETFEQVYDVACSDGLAVDPATHRCPDNGAKVNLDDCSITTDRGANELETLWADPDFDAGHRAFYYVRVLENPTCRWSTWDSVRAGVSPRSDLPKTLQERAWSSPIGVVPTS